MRVICIDKDAWPPGLPLRAGIDNPDSSLKDGEYYTVIDSCQIDGFTWLAVQEDSDWYYWEKCFSHLSSIDETEFERNYKTEPQTT